MVLFSGLDGAECPVLGPFPKSYFPLALLPEPIACGCCDPCPALLGLLSPPSRDAG